MKSILISLLLLATTVTFSQSIRLLQGNTDVTGTTITEKFILQQAIETKFKLYNSSDKDKKFKVTRIIKSKLWSDYYIAPIVGCIEYAPMEDSTVILPDTIKIKAKNYLPEINSPCTGLETYFYAENECKEYIVNFILWEVNGGKDSSEVTLHYTCTNGIHENHSSGNISNVYPNPVTHSAFFDYQIQTSFKQAKIVFVDVLGRQVKEVPIENKEGQVSMNITDLPKGFYAYQFLVDDHVIDSGKLIVQPSY